ncbi:MAG: acetyl-CoA carboxylase biotin carboxyl carrier protein subunit [Novosphingobium sp.]
MSEPANEHLARDIELLAELFKAGGWSEIRVESAGLGLLFSTDRLTPALGVARRAAVPASIPALQAPSASEPARPAAQSLPDGAIDPEWAAVQAPNLGTFYRSPKPGAAPFVEVGKRVDAATEVCLIEVMKLFTSVQAGVAGVVKHIAVADAELVEGGQALIYIERD